MICPRDRPPFPGKRTDLRLRSHDRPRHARRDPQLRRRKVPLTGGFSKAEVGGFWPMAAKNAGYDAIIIEGKADKPVYLFLTDETVEIRDAAHLWGKTVAETQDTLDEELGVKNLRTCSIGIGGENMVRYACVINDLKDAAGRGGMGAVMGSKNLKTIAAAGKWKADLADPKGIRDLTVDMNKNFVDNPIFNKSLHEVGTGEHGMMLGSNAVGNTHRTTSVATTSPPSKKSPPPPSWKRTAPACKPAPPAPSDAKRPSNSRR